MKELKWDPSKDEWLKRTRGTSFEDMVQAALLGIGRHPTRPNQQLMYFLYQDYVWLVFFVEGPDSYFLKTLYRSRKHTARYKAGEPWL